MQIFENFLCQVVKLIGLAIEKHLNKTINATCQMLAPEETSAMKVIVDIFHI